MHTALFLYFCNRNLFYMVSDYIKMLKKGATDEDLKKEIVFNQLYDFTSKFIEGKSQENATLVELYNFLMWNNIPNANLKIGTGNFSVTLSNVSVVVETYSYWRGYSLWVKSPIVLNRPIYLRCSVNDAGDFILSINNKMQEFLDNVELVRQEIEKKLKKSIDDLRLEMRKKEKLISMNVITIESLVKQMFKDFGEENVWFDHKKYQSHVYIEILGGKQQIDITIKHSDFKEKMSDINQQVRQLVGLISQNLMVRAVARKRIRI